MEKDKNPDISLIEFSKYVSPKIVPSVTTKWTLNGENNSYYQYILECYKGSVTNAAIIEAFSAYVYGDGLIDKNGININQYISKKDLRLIVQDYKTYGGFTVKVIWNLLHTAPIKIQYIPIFKIGLNIKKGVMQVDGYWFSWDWTDQGQYPPMKYEMYTGEYKGHNEEILMIQRPSSNDFFAGPDYEAALQYAESEMELANSMINHIKNGFQGGTLINMNNGVPDDEHLREVYKRKIEKQLTGSSNRNKFILSFNESKEQAITVDKLESDDVNEQYVVFDETAERKIIVGHKAPPVLFTGSQGNGFSNNADEIATAIGMLYRDKINPMRESIIDGLNEVFIKIDLSIDLEFKDFESFNNEQTDKTIVA